MRGTDLITLIAKLIASWWNGQVGIKSDVQNAIEGKIYKELINHHGIY